MLSNPRSCPQMNGFTYERHAIEDWLQHNNTEPETGIELTSKILIPNRRLRTIIRDL